MLVTSKIESDFSDVTMAKRDENGFIDLTDLNIQFEKESREKVGNELREKNWVEFSDGRVFLLKEGISLDDNENGLIYAELIMEELAKQVGLETAHYDLYIKDGKKGVLSEYCLKHNQSMYTFESLVGQNTEIEGWPENTNTEVLQENIIEFLVNEGLDKGQIKQILFDFQKRMVLDIFTLNIDRHTENISFRVTNDNGNMSIDLAPLYDNENSLLLDMDLAFIEEYCSEPQALSEVVDRFMPKIAIVYEGQDSTADVWKDTLDYYNDIPVISEFIQKCSENLDMSKALTDVESRIHARIPEYIKRFVMTTFKLRNERIKFELDLEKVDINR